LAENNSGQRNQGSPSRKEIIAVLDRGIGVVNAINVLSQTYGPPKGRWGQLFWSVMKERKAASANIRMGGSGAANAQSYAANNATTSKSGSSTGNEALQLTPNVPSIIVREPDAIIHPQYQLPVEAMYPDAEDVVNLQLFMRDPRFQQFRQSWRMQYQPAPPPPKPDIWQEMNTQMLQTMKQMMEMCLYISMFRSFSRN